MIACCQHELCWCLVCVWIFNTVLVTISLLLSLFSRLSRSWEAARWQRLSGRSSTEKKASWPSEGHLSFLAKAHSTRSLVRHSLSSSTHLMLWTIVSVLFGVMLIFACTLQRRRKSPSPTGSTRHWKTTLTASMCCPWIPTRTLSSSLFETASYSGEGLFLSTPSVCLRTLYK